MDANYKMYRELLRQRDSLNRQIREFEAQYTSARLFHIDAYIVSLGNFVRMEEIVAHIENDTDLYVKLVSYEKEDIIWNDDIDLNQRDCPISAYKKYFEEGAEC